MAANRAHSRNAVAAALVTALGACTEPSIQIEIDIMDGYGEQVASVLLHVVAPPAAEPFTCDDIAFGSISADALRLSQVQEVSAAAGSGVDLAGIPRLGRKLLWLEGRDRAGVPVVAGCTEVGTIEAGTQVRILAEPVTVVATPIAALDQPLPDMVSVLVSDIRAQPLSDVEVRWTVVGPAGQEVTGSVMAQDGQAQIVPVMPERPGPARLDVHVRWELASAAGISGFYPAEVMFEDTLPGTGAGLQRTELLYVVGRVGPAGEMGLAALGQPETTGNRRLYLAWYDPGAARFRTFVTPEPIPGAVTVAAVRRGGERDVVGVATATSWLELQPSGQLLEQPGPSGLLRRVVPVSACSGAEPGMTEVLLAQALVDGAVTAYGPDGQVVTSPLVPVLEDAQQELIRLLGAGCVSSLGGGEHPVVIYGIGSSAAQLFTTELSGVMRQGALVSYAPFAGFAPSLGSEPASLLGLTVDLEGATIVRYQLAPLGERFIEPAVVTQDASLTFMRAAQGGDVDGDGIVDVAGLLEFGLDDGERTQVRLQIVLGAAHRGQRLVGVSPPMSMRDPTLFVADFDGDGLDDLLLAGRDELRIFGGLAPLLP